MKLNLSDQKIKELLIQGNYVKKEDIKKAEEYSKAHKENFLDYLIFQEIINRDILGQAIAEYFGVSYFDLNSNQPAKEKVLKVPEYLAKKNRLILVNETEKAANLTTDEPDQPHISPQEVAVIKDIFFGKEIKLHYSLPEDIDISLLYYRKGLDTRFSRIIESQGVVAPEIIKEIVADAVAFRASDIHFDPQERNVLIRFRVDGVLYEAGKLKKEHYENILNRIKVQAKLRTDEHFSAQDGAIRYQEGSQQEAIDMRISIVPTLDGEKITIRLLAQYVRGFTMSDLGLSEKHQEQINRFSKQPFGMMLSVGPTGSGKTTTLYSLLKILNDPEVNIATIEDPVEYKIPGVNHIQVNQQTNLTFAKGLRSIVRQDPDIILVGEIRDQETAEIAVNAALTGHLLLSTFHANDAATAIPRLLDMGIEPFLLASTLEIIVAQRLARKICESCRFSVNYKKDDLQKLFPKAENYFPEESITLYQGKGCEACSYSGYKGRVAIFEIIEVSRAMEELIMTNPSAEQVWKLAQKEGSHILFDDGIEKVRNGVTTIEELLRVAAPPKD